MSEQDLTEEFRAVKDFPAYRVSNLGRVQSCWKSDGNGRVMSGEWRDLKLRQLPDGRLQVLLFANGKGSYRYVHRLVAEAFIGDRPAGLEICHWDGDPTNNRVENLRYDTRKGNIADRSRHGRTVNGMRHRSAKLDDGSVMEVLRLRAGGLSVREVARIFGVSHSGIIDIEKGRSWSHVTGITRKAGSD